jgi:hypothetical protein
MNYFPLTLEGAIMRKLLMMVTVMSALMVSAVFGEGDVGVEWTVVKSSPFGGDEIKAIAWGKDKFVAVGDKGKMAYSSDGVTWTAVKNSTFANEYGIEAAIAYGKDKFVAGFCLGLGDVDPMGQISYSLDGINWKRVTDDNYYMGVKNIVWGNDKFLGGDCGSGSTYIYSSDGITWKHNIHSCGGEGGSGIFSWGSNKYVYAGCHSWDGAGNYSYNIWFSSDGITWADSGKIPIIESFISAIAWGNGVFVAGSGDGQIVYSSDGISWKNQYPSTPRKQEPSNNAPVTNSPFGNNRIYSIAWGSDKFVAVGGTYTYSKDKGKYVVADGKIAYSLDGITWTVVKNYPFGKSGTTAIAYGNGIFVAGSSDGKIAYSK